MKKDEVILKVENVSKQYRLGTLGTGTISHDLNRWWAKIRGKEDPYLKIGEANDRSSKGNSQYVWALKDINFEVNRGEVLGIIGKNGAGKSTLLKILSKVTNPSTGSIKSKGRIASLLEVGTGFHPEMTGKENIFLNGAILGMTKKEISSKIDEIVEFSGCERYIDTPVKRYSSGMKVRLAFAVAAHLEPEILVVDEVLAVGDIEFQKKAVGKMQDISKESGRTVLFVSHNMAAVRDLCTKSILLDKGKVVFRGETEDTIQQYYQLNTSKEEANKQWERENAPGNENIKLLKVEVKPVHKDILSINSGIDFTIEFLNFQEKINLDCTLEINTLNGITVYHKGILLITDKSSKKGIYIVQLHVPPNLLNQDVYLITLIFGKDRRYLLYEAKDIVQFEINAIGAVSSTKRPGVLYLDFDKKIDFHEV